MCEKNKIMLYIDLKFVDSIALFFTTFVKIVWLEGV